MNETLNNESKNITTTKIKKEPSVNKFKKKKTADILVFPISNIRINNDKSSSGLNSKNVDDLIR